MGSGRACDRAPKGWTQRCATHSSRDGRPRASGSLTNTIAAGRGVTQLVLVLSGRMSSVRLLIRLVCRLGLGQQLFHLGLQLRLQLARMFIRKRAMSARIGVDLGPVQRHRAQIEHPHLTGQQQHLGEQPSISFKNRCRNVAIVS